MIPKLQTWTEREIRLAVQARVDVASAAEFCLRSERKGEPLSLYPGHHELFAATGAHKRLVVVASPKLGKTTLLTYMLLLHRLGNDPQRYRAKVWSATKTNAMRHTSMLRSHIEFNQRLQLLFPQLRPGAKWAEEEWTVARGEGPQIKEPSVWACGADAQNQGFRSQDDFFDDMVDAVISASRHQCEKQAEFIMDNESRVEADGQRIFVQNCFRRWDTGHLLVEKYGWHLHLMPAIDAMHRTLYPVIWSQADCDAYAPARKDQDLRCIPKREGDGIFHEAYIQKSLALGEGRTTVNSFDVAKLPEGVFTVTAIDPAGGKKKKANDLTAGVTLLVGPPSYFGLPPMGPDAHGHPIRAALILSVEAGKLSAPEMRAWIVNLSRRYGSAIFVEDAAVQDWMRQILATDAPDVPVGAFTTNASTKRHADLGFESLAARLSLGLLITPSYRDASGVLRVEPEVGRLLDELRTYDPQAHTGDRAMALWMADVSGRTSHCFQHAVGVAGDDVTVEELLSLGFTSDEIALTRPSENLGRGPAGKESDHMDSRAREDTRLMRDFLRRQGLGHILEEDEIDPEIAEIIASRF